MKIRVVAVGFLLLSSCAPEMRAFEAKAGSGQGVLDTMDGTVAFSVVPCAEVPNARKRACRFPAGLSRYVVLDTQLSPEIDQISVRVMDCGSPTGQGHGTEGYFCLRPSECDLSLFESLPRVSADSGVDVCASVFGISNIASSGFEGEVL